MRWRGAGAVVAVALLATAGCGETAAAPPDEVVRVAAASDLRFALGEITEELAQADPPVRVEPTYGSSGTFFQQISNGAPFDVYLSADLSYPVQLAQAGLADEADVFPYAVGRLVVWAPHDSPVDVSRGLEALTDPEATTVSIANPEHAPYGQAAVAAMTTAGVYDEVEDKLALGESVSQAAEFVQSGNAQVGVVALSLALAPEMSDQGRYEEVPLELFPRLDQGGVVLADAADREAADRLRRYLTGPDGVAVLERYGFILPGE